MIEVLAKGPNFVFAREFIQKNYGEPTWRSVITRMSNDAATLWKSAELDQAYPFAAFKEGVFALAEELGSPEMVETAEMYKHIADRSLSTVYKAFFRLTSPVFVIKNYPRLWDRFFTAGKVEIPESNRSHAVVSFTLPEVFLDWLPPACLGYSQKAVEMAGGKYFSMRELKRRKVSDAEWKISYRLSWN
jgi:hypothetical protein